MSLAAPFPYFGGKRRAASLVWSALGDPAGYVEPFAGSAAVLLARRPFKGRRVETLNDLDGWLVNTWRAIKHHPAEVASRAADPVTEIDYHARLAWLQERRTQDLVAWLEGHPEACDPKAAGWWLYVVACGIGNPFDAGPWRVDAGRLTKDRGTEQQGVNRELPFLGNAGRGVNRELPHLGDAGRGDRQARIAHYLGAIADRLATVRITCGTWTRVIQPSVYRAGAGGDGTRAIFLDPPYAISGDLYATAGDDAHAVAVAVRDWCATAPSSLRIVIAGYEDEHDSLTDLGWRKAAGKAGGGSGYSTDPLAGRRERLWLSPACVGHTQEAMLDMNSEALS